MKKVLCLFSVLFLFACAGKSGVNEVPMGMVYVEGGTFTMGDNNGEYDDEAPEHQVTVSSFYMSIYEVTQAEWTAIMGNNPSYFEGDNLPVDQVSWYAALEYCNRRSIAEGLTPVYDVEGETADWSANGYRLPTEAEWEYIAKGGNKNANYTYSGSDDIDAIGWYDDGDSEGTHPVGMKAPNDLGLYDVSGNVWEWVWDWDADYTAEDQTNPKGPDSGEYRMLRGGSWYADPVALRPEHRGYEDPDNADETMGLRVMRNIR
ncbi:MAG: formylglycine-generating enzyme family protein [Deferribacteraceae bacterium]|jgi:formylglycine-generating enzyme required for sulfatase activity|nr:formylglycine-generating enzyme family protein [Deferribacteraceae bacterium]